MTALHNVCVDLKGRSYNIHIGNGLLRRMAEFVPFPLENRRVFILTDENVSSPHGVAVYDALKGSRPYSIQMLALPSGEQTKSFAQLEKTIGWMLDHGVDRHSVLFAVGGGVIGDLGGLAAALVMRGIPFIQVPTTLLAQVDSSVGGKTAVNMPQGKNLAGLFYQPAAVICDLNTLETLPRRQLLAGYAETVKYGLINDPEFFIWLEKALPEILTLEPNALAKAIETACRKKAEIVEEDEREQTDVRALLNLGHTFGHALEAAAHYDGRLLHGEAVAIGTVLAFQLSVRLGLCSQDDADRVEKHLAAAGLPVRISMIFPPLQICADEIFEYMKHDKKAVSGKMAFILVHGIGKAFVDRNVEENDILQVVSHSMKGSAL